MKLEDRIINALLDRAGFDDWWEDIDEEIQEEIKEEMREIYSDFFSSLEIY